MAKRNEISIPRGIMNKDGVPVTTGEAMLDASCTCGMDCCNKILKLEGYNSETGKTVPFGMYIVDGVPVYEPLAEAMASVEALKATVPVVLPSTPITNGAFRFNVGNSDDNIPYLSGNIYQLNTTSALVGRELDFKISGTLTPVVLTSVTSGFTMLDGGGAIVTYPHTVVQSGGSYDYMFRIETGTDTAPVTVNIGFTYLGQPYILRLNRTV